MHNFKIFVAVKKGNSFIIRFANIVISTDSKISLNNQSDQRSIWLPFLQLRIIHRIYSFPSYRRIFLSAISWHTNRETAANSQPIRAKVKQFRSLTRSVAGFAVLHKVTTEKIAITSARSSWTK